MKAAFSALLIATFLFSCREMDTQPLNIGHRGARGHIAENTVASVEKAIELGVDGVEIDVFRCKSGEVVVIHDTTLDRTTNASGKVEDFTLAQLKEVVVEEHYTIPTLQEVLDVLSPGMLLNVELKGSNTAETVSDILQEYIRDKGWKTEDFIISSFSWEELKDFYLYDKELPIGILTEGDPEDAIPIAKELQAKAIHPNHKDLDRRNVKAIHDQGLKVYTWTVNTPLFIKRMKAIGVDGIITDYPERVNED